jgi:hypothetical protein
VSHYWPVLFYVPGVLLLLASLSLTTGIIDRREHKKMRQQL